MRLKASNRQGGKQAESNVTVALGNEKARLKGIRSDCRHLTAVLVGRGVWETAGWLDGLSAETSPQCACHVFKWHRLHFNSGIIHKCGTAAYKSERRKLHCDRKEERGRKRETTVNRTPQERESETKQEKNKTFGCNPLVQLPSARFTSKTTGTTLAKGQGLKAAHNTNATHTHMHALEV